MQFVHHNQVPTAAGRDNHLQGVTEDDKERFTLQMLDHLDRNGASGCRNMGELAQRFIASNPQWGGSLGHQCSQALCEYVEASNQPMGPLERLKKICCTQIVQHGAGLTEEDRHKTEVASKVLKCCCRLQVGRGNVEEVSTEEESGDSTKDTESDADTEEKSGDSTKDTESDSEELDTGDDAIKEAMADVMYVCCQRPMRRREMLKNADRQLVKCICDCANAVLMGDIPINKVEKDNLEKHKVVLRKLNDESKTTEEKKKIIVQSGGNFLLSLIPTMIGAMTAMFQ